MNINKRFYTKQVSCEHNEIKCVTFRSEKDAEIKQ